MAGVHRGRGDDPRGPRGPHRPRRAARGAGALRGPPAQDRVVLGGLERDRDRVRHPRRSRACSTSTGRCPSSTSRRRRRTWRSRWTPTATRSRPRTRCSSRPTSSSAGRGRPGVLVARRELFRNRVPSMPGGGTVAYVNPVEHVYLTDIEHREEGGTPAIVESIRAGLVFGLKAAVGVGGDPRARGGVHPPGARPLGGQPQHRDPGQPPGGAAVDRLVRRAPWGPLPPPQLRGRAAQRPVRDPVAGRLLVRGAVRAPAARDRPGDVARVRARDLPGLRGDQAGLGAGQLQLLHQRGGLRVHPRRRGPRRNRGLAPPGRLRVPAGQRPVAPP